MWPYLKLLSWMPETAVATQLRLSAYFTPTCLTLLRGYFLWHVSMYLYENLCTFAVDKDCKIKEIEKLAEHFPQSWLNICATLGPVQFSFYTRSSNLNYFCILWIGTKHIKKASLVGNLAASILSVFSFCQQIIWQLDRQEEKAKKRNHWTLLLFISTIILEPQLA